MHREGIIAQIEALEQRQKEEKMREEGAAKKHGEKFLADLEASVQARKKQDDKFLADLAVAVQTRRKERENIEATEKRAKEDGEGDVRMDDAE